MMKTIVLVALLAAAGCSKKGSDCDASIEKGMDKIAAEVKKANAPNPQQNESRLSLIAKVKGALIQRCNEDKWPSEVVSCYTTIASSKDAQACQAKLNPEQQQKLNGALRPIMRSAMGGSRMPPDVAGHPAMLPGSGDPAAAPEGSTAAPAGATAPTGSTGPAGSPIPAGAGATPKGSGSAPAGSAAPSAGGW